jgi:hypothetical protein
MVWNLNESNFLLKLFESLHLPFLRLLLANISPARLNIWNSTFINSLYINLNKLNPGRAIHRFAMNAFDLHFMENSVTETLHLLDKLWPEVV